MEIWHLLQETGKAVEINALWYNALKIMQEFSGSYESKEEANIYKEMAEDTKISFNNKFYNKRRKCLYDVIGDSRIRQIKFLVYH